MYDMTNYCPVQGKGVGLQPGFRSCSCKWWRPQSDQNWTTRERAKDGRKKIFFFLLTGFEIWLLLPRAGDARQRLHLPPVERLVLSPTGSTGFKMLHFKLEETWLNAWLCLIQSLFINPPVWSACLKGLCLNTFYCFWFVTTQILNWRVIGELRHHEADVCGEKCLDALELPSWGHVSDFLQRLHAILVLTSK